MGVSCTNREPVCKPDSFEGVSVVPASPPFLCFDLGKRSRRGSLRLYIFLPFFIARAEWLRNAKIKSSPRIRWDRGASYAVQRVDRPRVRTMGHSQPASSSICTKRAGVTTGGSCSGHSKRSLSPDTIRSASCSRAR